MTRRLAAILAYDAVGYSLAMGRDEAATLDALKGNRANVIDPHAKMYGGRTIKLTGDGALLEFASAVDAVSFAVAMQRGLAERNGQLPEEQRQEYRIGINIGDVVVDGEDIYGDGVNIAVRLETLAKPGGITIHRSVRDQLRGKLDLDFEDLGEVEVKNIEQPVRAFNISLNEKAAALRIPQGDRPDGHVRRPRGMLVVAGLLAVFFAFGGVLWWQPWSTDFEPVKPETMHLPLPSNPSIAVLALEDHSVGDDKGYLSDAISEGIITALSRFSELFVIARNSSFTYRGTAVDVRKIARELGVRYILEGSQQKAGEHIRVTVQLIDALAGNHIWSETYDRNLSDMFAVQDEIAGTVASTVGGKVIEVAGEEAKRADIAQLSAFQHHLTARRYYRQFNREGLIQAHLANLAAVEAAPNQPYGYQGLAFVYVNESRYGWLGLDSKEALQKARQAAQKALDLAPNDYGPQFVMGYVHSQAGEPALALARFEKALQLNPSAADVLSTMVEPLVYTGRLTEAVDVAKRAIRLDPHHPSYFLWNLGWAQYFAGQYEDALESINRMSNMPNLARRTLAAIYVRLNQLEKARSVIKTFLEQSPDYTLAEIRNGMGSKFQDPELFKKFHDDLRTAGLPE